MIIGVSNRFRIEYIITHQTPPHTFAVYIILVFWMLHINIQDISSQFQFFPIHSFASFVHDVHVPVSEWEEVHAQFTTKRHATYDDPPKHMCTHVYISINISLCPLDFRISNERENRTAFRREHFGCTCSPWPMATHGHFNLVIGWQ